MLRSCALTRIILLLLLLILLVFGCANSLQQQQQSSSTPTMKRRQRRKLPDKLLIGYANNCNNDDDIQKITNAIQDGVNVIVWAFMELQRNNNIDEQQQQLVPVTSLDFMKVKNLINNLDQNGYDDTIHLISFGGWNGPHLETSGGVSAEDWYKIWKESVAGDIFHGIDWDLEGHDNLQSPTNQFTIECLDMMGRISQLAKEDGYIIGMAPPQSYLDIHDPKFSRYVNLTDPNRLWHNEFHYFGSNVYSYLLSKYGEYIDFVSVQFYESYSKAAMEIYHNGKSPSEYLESYVCDHISNDESFHVNFDDDPTIQYSSRRVNLPLNKLVFGFANGWAKNNNNDNDNEKTIFVEPEQIKILYNNLQKRKLDDGIAKTRLPRGLMYWVITEEGNQDVYYAKSLNKILKIRPVQLLPSSSEKQSSSSSGDATTSSSEL